MAALKHIGKMKNTGSKVVVVFRTLPGESNTALVLPAATLPDSYHNSLMALIETDQAQQSFELGELMFVRLFPDGRQMLQAMQQDGRLQKVPTDTVVMTPTNQTDIVLADLNVLIAEQKNCTIDDLCTFVKGYNASKDAASKNAEVKTVAEVKEVPAAPARAQAGQNEVLTDLDIAKSYRSQADAMYKEAARLRKQADDLDPPKKKATKVSETADA